MKQFLLVFFLILGLSAAAQNNELRAYTLENGLPQSQVYAMAQDSIGYLWLGTQGGGLARFDGDNFTVFKESDGLNSNYIESLAVQKDSLYIGTKKGLSIYSKGKISAQSMPQVNAIQAQNNAVFLATNAGIYFLDNFGNVTKSPLNQLLNTAVIHAILFDGSQYWIASKEGLFKTKSLKRRSPISQLETVEFTSLVQHKNKVFAASFVDGILVYDISEEKKQTYVISQLFRINNLTIQNNELWVATDTHGIKVLDIETYAFQKNIGRANGLSVSHVRQTLQDRQGNIWIGTSGGGLYKYFANEFTHFDQDTGLKGNRIYAVHALENELWFSVAEKGLSYIDSLGIKNILAIPGFDDVKIKTITSDKANNIWAGSEGKGILLRQKIQLDSFSVSGENINTLKFDTIPITKTKHHVINEANGFPSNWIRDILVTGESIWAATHADGIVQFNYNTASKKLLNLKVFDKEKGLDDLLIRDLFYHTETDAVWYGTKNGHIGFIKDNTLTHLGQVLPQISTINSIILKEKSIFLGTADTGIWVAKASSKPIFTKLEGAKNTSSNNSFLLLFDQEENLWTGSERGVDKIVLNNKNEIVDVFHFGRNDGFLGIETCLNAVSQDKENALWFGAIYGLTKYNNKQQKQKQTNKPTVYFEQITAGYKALDSFPETQWVGSNLQLKATDNQMSFSYKTVDINHPNTVQYRFKLDNKKWSPWSKSEKENFAGLAYGAHQFTAQSRNYRWLESDPIVFNFTIETPLLKQAWFQWLIALCSITTLFFIVWRYITSIKKKNTEAQKQLALQNHLLGLEQKALRLQMNPHFIFNVLNGIKAMGQTNPTKMNTTITSFAKLLRGILNNSRQDTISLKEEINTLENYIEVELLMAATPFTYSIEVDSEIDPEEIIIPPMLIQPFVENAIKHGILKTEKQGQLKVTFSTLQEHLQCTIIDNGPGILTSQQNKTTTSHQSVALDVTRERIESLSGKGSLLLKEIKKDHLVLGTEVAFKIPLETDF